MSQVIKCTRLLPNACRLIPRYASTSSHVNTTAATAEQAENARNSKYLFGTAAAFGTACLFGISAFAKEIEDDDDEDEEDEEDEDEEYDEEEEEMSAMIEASLSEALELPTADGKYEKWAAAQQRYLLLSEAKRAAIELRDVTAEELAECDSLYDSGKLTDCEDKLVELNTVSPGNDEVLWRLARIKWIYGKGYQSNHQHKVFHVAHAMACEAAEINPDNGNAHRWIAVLGHFRAEKEGIKAGVLNMEAMKYHLDRAIECNPDDNIAWTLLGHWYMELADMTRLQRRWSRMFAKVNPPAGSYKKALACFVKSDSIEPWVQNTMHIAKAHLRLRNKEKAIEMFQRIRDETVIASCEDYRMRKEARIYIHKLTDPSLYSKLMSIIYDGYLESYRIPLVMRDTQSQYIHGDAHYYMITGKEYTV